MNKKYKSAFSVVCPSESSVERIFDMTKKKKITYKPLLVAAIVTALMAVSLVSANAATDGALAEKAEQVVENAVESVKVLINGEEANPKDINYKHKSEIVDGKVVNHYSFDVEDKNGDKGEVCFEVHEDHAAISGYGTGAHDIMLSGGFKAEVIDENGDKVELNVPTTSEATE